MARPKRFELLTPRFVVWCSIQLSYGRLIPPPTGLRDRGHSYRLDPLLARVAAIHAYAGLHAGLAAQASASFSTRIRYASSAALAIEKISANPGRPSASGTTAISSATIR